MTKLKEGEARIEGRKRSGDDGLTLELSHDLYAWKMYLVECNGNLALVWTNSGGKVTITRRGYKNFGEDEFKVGDVIRPYLIEWLEKQTWKLDD